MEKYIEKFKSGFTLAEVLITLVIIGVIAAMTIPTLINNLQKNELRSQFKKAVSVTSQAVQKMKTDYGDIIYDVNVDSAPDFRSRFIKYFSVICKDNCVNVSKYINRAGVSDHEFTNQMQNCFTVQDGMIFCFYKGGVSHAMYIDVDINGDKGPNRWGYDFFTFYINNDTQSLTPSSPGVPYSGYVCNNTSTIYNGPACTEAAMRDSEYFKKLL